MHEQEGSAAPPAGCGGEAGPPPGSWPFTGRDGTLAELAALLVDPARPALLISGPAGVGKTRLARELLSTPPVSGGRVLTASATESAARIPFGALAHLLPATLPTTGGRPNLLRVLGDALLTGGGAQGDAQQVLFVDDAHLLDDGSAALLLHTAVRGGARIVLTARSGVPLPDAVEALLRGGYAARVDLPPLAPDSVGRLLERALRGQVETSTAHRLWQGSDGNVLWLQQLVEAGLASGALAVVAEVWRWQGAFRLSTHLADLVEQRIGRLSPAVRRAAELLALGEPLGALVLERLTGPVVLDELDHRDLVVGEQDGRRAQVRLAHPLYGEVLRRAMPPHRRRRHCRDLAEAVERTGLRRRDDLARVADWRLESGDRTDPRFLLSAAERAIATLDFTLAARLAQAACEAGGGPAARRALAVALGHTGQGIEAEQVHSGLPGTVLPERDQLRSVQLRAANLYLTLDQPADAVDLLRRTEQAMPDQAARAELAAVRAVLLAVQADWPAYAQAAALARRQVPADPRTTVRLRYAECVEHFCHGRTEAALAILESVLPGPPGPPGPPGLPGLPDEDDMPLLGAALMSWLATIQSFAGRLDEAAATAAAQYRQARERAWVGSQGGWQFYLGRIAARRGWLRSAQRHMREAVSTLRDDATWGQQALLLGEWAVVEAQTGDAAKARMLLDQAHLARVESYRCFHIVAFQLAQPWILAAQGRLRDAARLALRVAEDARHQRTLLWEAELLHLPVRLGQCPPVADRLAELVTVTDAPHIRIYAEHAAAVAARDADAAERVCTAFETAGMRLHAAEAAAHAARLWSRRGSTAPAQRAADRCHQLTRECEGVMTPAVLACWTPGLTDRERDIARLAAAGASSREIAGQLGITVRTVDNHLYRVYRKTGVAGRDELRSVLALGHAESPDEAAGP
ncbi:LuxR C-terminal-related transcriptional regulator [Peterkaempfera bronchialis]|uniref:LuxR C-terminal-related transcriptional regulator n=1 Tax=Peterkaempfera bronchialis TaxID=2126346 RepID=UPI003C2BE32B